MSDPFGYPFGGSDEGSHYMCQAAAEIQKEVNKRIYENEEGKMHPDLGAPEQNFIRNEMMDEIFREREREKIKQDKLKRINENHGWIQTYTGKKFYPTNPKPEDICIRDIAHSLANMCRFTGHVKRFYSVAQHCVLVSYLVDKEFAKPALLHDASEALIVDVPKPLKRLSLFDEYRKHEHNLQTMIFEKYGWFGGEVPEIKEVDTKMLATEARDLMSPLHPEWNQPADPYPFTITPVNPEEAESMFLNRFKELILKEINGEERYNLFIGE